MEEVYRQLLCLFLFMITGIVIGILFDMFRIFRKSFKTPDFITYVQDILFWLLAGGIVLFAIFKFNHGEIRSYLFFGIAFGILIYIITISKFIIKYCVIIIKSLKRVIGYPIRFIVKLLQTTLFKPIQFFIQKRKTINYNKKQEKMTNINNKNKKKQINLKEKKGIL